MIDACPAPPASLGMVRGLIQTVDCGVRVFAESGYDALTAPPSPFPTIVTALLTLYVAFVGWGLMSGRGPRLADTPQIAVRIGAIVALTTAWPLFQALVFDNVFDGMTLFAAILTGPIRQAGGGDIWAELQSAYDQIVVTAAALATAPDPDALPGGPAATAEVLWSASTALLAGTLGVVLVAKIVAGVLTALGPIAIALMLLAHTHSLFAGWLRALIISALAPFAATLGLALLLALLEPRLASLAAMRASGVFDLAVVAGVATLIFIFAAAQGCLVLMMGVVGASFVLPRAQPATEAAAPSPTRNDWRDAALAAPSRAAQVADAVRRIDMRDTFDAKEGRLHVAVSHRAIADGDGAIASGRLGDLQRRSRSAAPRDGLAS